MRVRRRLRRLKRFAYFGIGVGVVVAVRRAKARREAQPRLGPVASWPPLEVGEPPVAALGDLVADESAPARAEPAPAPGDEVFPADPEDPPLAAWVAAQDGTCPLSHPIKANDNSGIFHTPGGRFYDRTQAERCYRDATAAEADGYRAAKGA